MKQLVVSQYKQSIQKLTRTFLTLSLADVALRVKLQLPKMAQQYLLNMVSWQHDEILCYLSPLKAYPLELRAVAEQQEKCKFYV